MLLDARYPPRRPYGSPHLFPHLQWFATWKVVAVARDALANVINMQKLQKELLQSSLRPILLNLADYRKLSVPLLLGLSRLLSLLSNFFNLT